MSQYRLAFHLTLATAIYAAVLWTAQQIAPQRPLEAPARLRFGAVAIAALVLAQIYLGALVAGLPLGTPGATNMLRIAYVGSQAAGD